MTRKEFMELTGHITYYTAHVFSIQEKSAGRYEDKAGRADAYSRLRRRLTRAQGAGSGRPAARPQGTIA